MKIIGITRIRNEEAVIEATLNHLSDFLDGVYVMDDASEDDTVKICKDHLLVKGVLLNTEWDNTTVGRNKAEGELRQQVYQAALKERPDWIYYFDADEYIEIEIDKFDPAIPYYYARLFDFYITEEDKGLSYMERKWMGPEFRDIPMIYSTKHSWLFTQRVPKQVQRHIGGFAGYVKHYGKAMSVEQWEKDVAYYVDVRWNAPQYVKLQQRWMKRKGKVIHTHSDFDRSLITWEDRKDVNQIVRL